jgi:hypothetical protein
MNRLSRRLSSQKKKIDNKYPDISRKYRSNSYTDWDYDRFGDDVIRKYFSEHPLATWGIDLSWRLKLEKAINSEYPQN